MIANDDEFKAIYDKRKDIEISFKKASLDIDQHNQSTNDQLSPESQVALAGLSKSSSRIIVIHSCGVL